MRKLLWIIIPLVFLGATVELEDGTSLVGKSVEYSPPTIWLDSTRLNIDSVRSIILTVPEEGEYRWDTTLALPVDTLNYLAEKAESQYPDVAGITLIDWGRNLLREDGTRAYIYHYAGKILNENAKDWATIRNYFEEGREKVTILFARTITPDGDIIWMPKSNIEVSTPPMGSDFFEVEKILSFSLPSVEIGSIIEYAYVDEYYNPEVPGFFFPQWYFQQEGIPVVSSKLTVVIPETLSLHYKLTNFPERGKVEENIKDGQKHYYFELSGSPPLITEPKMPALGDVEARLKSSVLDNWDYIYNTLGKWQERRMEITPEIQRLADSLTTGLNNDSLIIDKLYRYVQDQIKYVSIKRSYVAGQTGHSASWTLKKKLGDCTDKSILLATLLKAKGIKATPVIIETNSGEDVDRSLPTIDGNHAITKVWFKGKRYFIDGTGNLFNFPYAWSEDYGVTYLDAVEREVGRIYIPPANWFSLTEIVEAELENNGDISFTYKSIPEGIREANFREWWEFTNPEDYRRIFGNWASSIIPQATLESYQLPEPTDLTRPFYEKFQGKARNFPVLSGDYAIINLSWVKDYYRFPETSLQKRKYPIEYENPILHKHRVEIKIPSEWKVVSIPQPLKIENKWGSYSGEFRVEDNLLVFTDEYRRDSLNISVEDYQEYKSFNEKITALVKKGVFFER